VTVRSGLCALVAASFLISSCVPASATSARDIPAPQVVATSTDEMTVNVIELFCQTCAEQIQDGCRAIAGVTSVHVDRHEHQIMLRFDPSVTTAERVLAAVDDVVASIP